MKLKLYTYRVTGNGDFPIDMLRYDRCSPKSQEDAHQLAMAMHGGPWVEHSITVVGYHEPTKDRWASFGWYVDGEPSMEKVDLV